MKKILFVLILLISTYVSGQYIHFSQFYQTPLIINPALTGIFNGDHRVLINYKDQWRSIGMPYKTFAISYDMALFKQKWENIFLGAGFAVFRDKAGNSELGITQLNLSLSGIFSINYNHKVSAGLQGGLAQRSVNYSGLKWGNQFDGNLYDPNIDPGETFEPFIFPDFSAGLSWTYGTKAATMSSFDELKLNAGVALYHINRPKHEFDDVEKLYSRFVVHGGAYIGLKNSSIALVPSVLFLNQGPLVEVNLGTMVRYAIKEESKYTHFVKEVAVLVGGYYRVGDAFIPGILFEFANFAMGITYDVNVS
ncbi:MAG: PorP/SprF family type IX secretion system membrane protein, partial [Bacteroidetes bacterium]|nr:PorP/SprF family type IX secretion system membrane protein [Bacteroidota bacterium]